VVRNEGQHRSLARVRLACGRVAGGAQAISEAYSFGVSEGSTGEPWTAAYHRAAVHVYAQSLPRSYQKRIGSLFIQGVEAMDALDVPTKLVEDCFIIMSYFRNASSAIAGWLAADGSRSHGAGKTPSIDDERPPRVIHYDGLAVLTTVDGVRRLERAAIAVQRHIGAPSAAILDDQQHELLNKLAGGAAIVDIAADLGYSERTIYRNLRRLYRALGVADRMQAVHKVAAEGGLDD
jgi:DNA-binding CsgD family transcriptional regulator